MLKQGVKQQMRNAVFEYWKSKFADLNMSIGQRVELITGSTNQPLYYLVLASHEKLADKIWEDVAKIDPQKEFWT